MDGKNRTERYISHLPKILQGYDESVHTSTGTSSNLAWKDKSTHPKNYRKATKLL